MGWPISLSENDLRFGFADFCLSRGRVGLWGLSRGMTRRLPCPGNRCHGRGFRSGALAGQASSCARRAEELATPSHRRLAASLWSFAVEYRAKRSKTRCSLARHSPAHSRQDAGLPWCRFSIRPHLLRRADEKMFVWFIWRYTSAPPQPFFPRPPLRSNLRGGRGTSQGGREACRRERGQARHARR